MTVRIIRSTHTLCGRMHPSDVWCILKVVIPIVTTVEQCLTWSLSAQQFQFSALSTRAPWNEMMLNRMHVVIFLWNRFSSRPIQSYQKNHFQLLQNYTNPFNKNKGKEANRSQKNELYVYPVESNSQMGTGRKNNLYASSG